MNKLLHTFCLLIAVVALCGAADFPQDRSDLRPDPAVRFGTLTNGVRYAIRANAEPKGRASLRFGVLTGSLQETEDQRGLAHFLEHMAFNGSKHFPAGTLVEYFQRLGMRFGGDTNAFTSFDRTVYVLELPDTTEATIEKAFRLFADYGGGLKLAPEEIERERGIILSEERARDSVGLRSLRAEFAFLLPETKVADRLPIGSKEVVATAPRERFVDFYDTWYRPEHFVVVAVGDFEVGRVEAQLRQALEGLRPRGAARPRPDVGVVRAGDGVQARLHHDPDAPAVTVSVQALVPLVVQPDTGALRLQRLRRGLAVAMLNRRLAVLAKQESAPFTGGSAQVEEMLDLFRTSAVELTCKPEQWKEALAIAEQELRRSLVHGFQAAELREAVAGVRNRWEQAVKTAATRSSSGLAGGLVKAIIDDEVFTSPEADLAMFGPALDQMTAEACADAWRSLWSETEGRHLFVSGNLRLEESAREIAEAYSKSMMVAVAAPPTEAETIFAYTDFGPEGTVAKQTEITDLGITLVEYANGVRLNLKPTEFEAGRVRISLRFGAGSMSEPKDRPGLARTAGGMLIGGGLGRHSIDEINRIFAGKTVSIGFVVRDDACVLSGTTNRDDLTDQFQLLCAFLTDPGYRAEGLRQYRKGMEQTYLRLARTVEGPLNTVVPALLAGNDPRFGLPERDVLFARTTEEVRAWLTPQQMEGPVEIAVVGDFDPAAVIQAGARTFGALAPRRAEPAYEAEREVAMAGPLERDFRVPTEVERGIVQLHWPATDGREVRRARRLNLLAAVLQDRLRLKLREEMGGTYSPTVSASLSDTFTGFGFIVAEATVAPDQTAVIADAIRQVAARMAAEGITEDELQRAKQPLLVGLRTSERQNPYWLGNVLSAAQEQPQRLDWARDRYADNAAIYKADLDELAKQYLSPERSSRFISLPETGTHGP